MPTSLRHSCVVEESGRALNEVDFPLQSEVGVLEPPLSVRRIDGAVVIGSEEILSPAAIGRRQAVALRRVRFEELDDGLDADAVFRESDLPIDASEKRIYLVENDRSDLIERVRRDDVRMRDVELCEVVKQVPFSEVLFVRVIDESTEEVIAGELT